MEVAEVGGGGVAPGAVAGVPLAESSDLAQPAMKTQEAKAANSRVLIFIVIIKKYQKGLRRKA
jgi:hypothetical protein